MSSPDLPPEQVAILMPDLTALVAQASALIRRMSATQARRKADGSPVTAADEAAESLILDGLTRLLPGTPAVAEERLGTDGPPALGGTFALIDALDGTKEFIAGRDEFTVNLGLVSGGTPVAGIIAAPARGRLWRGVAGRGAERLMLDDDRTSAPEPIHVRQWPTSGAVALVSRSHADPATEALLSRLPTSSRESCGSSLKFCRVAEGSADLYPRLGPTSEWDIAAGHALVVAAGGIVIAEDGRPLAYGRVEAGFRVPGFITWGDPAQARTV